MRKHLVPGLCVLIGLVGVVLVALGIPRDTPTLALTGLGLALLGGMAFFIARAPVPPTSKHHPGNR